MYRKDKNEILAKLREYANNCDPDYLPLNFHNLARETMHSLDALADQVNTAKDTAELSAIASALAMEIDKARRDSDVLNRVRETGNNMQPVDGEVISDTYDSDTSDGNSYESREYRAITSGRYRQSVTYDDDDNDYDDDEYMVSYTPNPNALKVWGVIIGVVIAGYFAWSAYDKYMSADIGVRCNFGHLRKCPAVYGWAGSNNQHGGYTSVLVYSCDTHKESARQYVMTQGYDYVGKHESLEGWTETRYDRKARIDANTGNPMGNSSQEN
jgi:hypothetical protein